MAANLPPVTGTQVTSGPASSEPIRNASEMSPNKASPAEVGAGHTKSPRDPNISTTGPATITEHTNKPTGDISRSSPNSPSQPTQRPTSQSEDSVEEEEPKGRHKKVWPRVPFLRRPIPRSDGPWLRPGQQAVSWLNLFYDLAVAAVLSTFGNAHEVDTPSDIPTYLSYYVIIQWIWATQTYYDIRFQAEDVVHRVYKAAQICLFVYIGAAAGNWNLAKIRDPDSVPSIDADDYETHLLAAESFTTVLAAFIASRVLLAIQYLMSAILAKQAHRKMGLQISSAMKLILSTVISVVALALPATSTPLRAVKITLLYLAILVEFIGLIVQLNKRFSHHISVAAVAERYGALTLVILGEGGFNSLTKAFNNAISGGLSNRSGSTYAQVFLAIGIMVMVYLFLFSWFNPEEEVTQHRALAWQSIHLPLHLGILLLMAAMVNTVIVISYAHGLDIVATAFFGQTIPAITNGTSISSRAQSKIERYLNKLDLEPDWDTESSYLSTLVNVTQPSADFTIAAYQYFGQVITATTAAYGLKLDSKTWDALSDLYAINATYTANSTQLDEFQSQASNALNTILSEPVSSVLSGTLWLFPCAGFVLILAAIRSFLWYRLAGIDHYLIHGGMVIFGVILGLLGLLDIGRTSVQIDVNSDNTFTGNNSVAPMYILVVEYVPLVIVLGVYALVYFGAAGVAGYTRWRRRRRREQKDIALMTMKKA